MSVILETSIGDITIDLYVKERPRTCLNFLKLCKLKYYNFHLFHTVQHNFIAQTGDPTGTGRGGESVFSKLYGEQAKYFEAELTPRIKHTKNGTLSMVNDGNNRHGSQFFITLNENNDYLDKQNHTVFGEVSEGFEIIEKLNSTILDDENRPMKDVRIYHTVVLDDPLSDPPGLDKLMPDNSPCNTKEHLEPRIGADSDTDDEKDLNEEELEEINKDREARTNARILEVIGDIPDADVKPPDNVLFVCKLNPATNDDDLEVIFSRFGKIISCEVIRNQKTNESLQYAFIEFEKAEDCEQAYFKMDNVLIDDRRIHVDFSQSVSKIRWDRHSKNKDEDEAKPQYKIKDFERRNDNYEYVFDPESERQPEKESRKHQSRDKKSKRKRSTSREKKRKHRRSLSEESDNSPEMSRKRRPPPFNDEKRRHGSPSEENRRKRRSPSPRKNRKRSSSLENRKKHCSPSEDDRRPCKTEHQASRRGDRDRRRERSPEENRRRRRSHSREESSPRRGKYQDDRKERNNRPRNY